MDRRAPDNAAPLPAFGVAILRTARPAQHRCTGTGRCGPFGQQLCRSILTSNRTDALLMHSLIRLADYRRKKARVYFTRHELSQLLAVYSSRVAHGEWRDYAIDHAMGVAMFSVFRHTHEQPVYAVIKAPVPSGHSFTVVDSVRKLKRSDTLSEVLDVLRPTLRVVAD